MHLFFLCDTCNMETPTTACPNGESLQIAHKGAIRETITVFESAITSLESAGGNINEEDKKYVTLFSSYLQSLKKKFEEFEDSFKASADTLTQLEQQVTRSDDINDDALKKAVLDALNSIKTGLERFVEPGRRSEGPMYRSSGEDNLEDNLAFTTLVVKFQKLQMVDELRNVAEAIGIRLMQLLLMIRSDIKVYKIMIHCVRHSNGKQGVSQIRDVLQNMSAQVKLDQPQSEAQKRLQTGVKKVVNVNKLAQQRPPQPPPPSQPPPCRRRRRSRLLRRRRRRSCRLLRRLRRRRRVRWLVSDSQLGTGESSESSNTSAKAATQCSAEVCSWR